MTRTVIYKGFIIQPAPRHLVEGGRWKLNLFILWSTQNEVHSRHFYTADEFAAEDQAAVHCISYGKLIIDGKIPGFSVG